MFENKKMKDLNAEFDRFVGSALDCDTEQAVKSIKKMAEMQNTTEELVLLGLAITFVEEPKIMEFILSLADIELRF